jgi:hypothetical protein
LQQVQEVVQISLGGSAGQEQQMLVQISLVITLVPATGAARSNFLGLNSVYEAKC